MSSDDSNPYARPTAYPLDPGRARIGMSAGPLQPGLRRPAGMGILSGSPLPMGGAGAPWGVAAKRPAEPPPAPEAPPPPAPEAPEAEAPVWTLSPLEVVASAAEPEDAAAAWIARAADAAPAVPPRPRGRRADWVPAAVAFAVAAAGIAILVAVASRPAPQAPSALPAFAAQTAIEPPAPPRLPPASLRGPAEAPAPRAAVLKTRRAPPRPEPAAPQPHEPPRPVVPALPAAAAQRPVPAPAPAPPSDPNAPIATHTPG